MANKISLDIIFSSPLFWKSGKICDFFTAAHKYIQDTTEDRCKIFKDKLDSDAQSPTWNLWNGKANWRNVVGKNQFELVTTYLETGNADKLNDKQKPRRKYWQIRSVVELLGIIRNKHEHNGRYSDKAKNELNWFQVVNETFQFDPNLYAKYWLDKFPRLALFLWMHFSEYQDVPTLKAFYSSDLSNQHGEYTNVPQLLSWFKDALREQMDRGAVLDRYMVKCDHIPIILEFRTLPADIITQLLDGSMVLKSKICQNNVSCYWINQTTNTGNYESTRLTNYPICDNSMICVICVFAKTIADLGSNVLKEIEDCHCGSTRIIIFTSNDFKSTFEFTFKCSQWATTHFGYVSEHPIFLKDISPSIQDIVKSHGEVCLQGSKVKLSNLLPKNIDMKTRCLNSLSGNVLNTILKGGFPKIFRMLALPNVPSFYIKRNLRRTLVIDVEILKLASYKNIFLCLEIDKEHLKDITKCKDTDVTEIGVLPKIPECFSKFIILRHRLSNEILQMLNEQKYQNIHVVRFLQEKTFEWVGTLGSANILEQNCKHFMENIIPKSEAEFLRSLEAINKPEKLVLIADKPGMGKSCILASFATQLADKFSDRLVTHLNVNAFVEELVECLPLSESSMVSLLSQIASDNDFERKLIYGWLYDKTTNSKPTFELMLDGLDETSDTNRKLVLEAVTILLDCFPVVRVWITLRNHMLNELASKFGTYGYKLLPLSIDDQSELIAQLWTKYSNQNSREVIHKYRIFATECLQLQSVNKNKQITGIPLLCRLIAEIYENKVLEQDFTLCSNTTLSELYLNMFERKLEIYLKKKCDLSTLTMNHIIANTMRENFERWHLYFAIKLIFPGEVSGNFIYLLQSECSSQDEIKEAVLQFGLIDKLHPLTFIHRTFAEFLVGRFAFKILSKNVVSVSQESLEKFVLDEVFRFEIHKTTISNKPVTMQWKPQTICVLSYPVVNYFLNDLLKPGIEETELCSKSIDFLWTIGVYVVTHLTFRENFVKMLPLLAATCRSELRSLFSYLLQDEQNLKGMIVLSLLSHHFHYIIDIIKLGKYFQPETWHELQSYDKNEFGMVHWSMYSFCHKNIWPYFEGEFFDFLKFVASIRPDVFEERDKDGLTPLLMLVKAIHASEPTYYKLIDFLVYELRVSVYQKSYDNNTVLHIISPATPNIIDGEDITILRNSGQP